MKNKTIILTILAVWLVSATTSARIVVSDTLQKLPKPKIPSFYIGTSFDGALLSTAFITKNTASTGSSVQLGHSMGTVRFTYMINTGLTFNFNVGSHLGFFTGIDLKNLGFIDKNSDGATVKRRTYNLGVPVGIKIGNMVPKKSYFFLGGGADFPINYREKTFVIKDQKTKFSEWFSTRNAAIMPYVFTGIAINRGLSFKVQYYPTNFLNPDFEVKGVKIYKDYNVNIALFTLGYAVPAGKKRDLVTNKIKALNNP